MNVVEILCLKGLHLDLAKYVVLQTYKGCGFDALNKGQDWLFSCQDFYPLKDPEKTWNACAANGLLHMLKLLHKYGIEGYLSTLRRNLGGSYFNIKNMEGKSQALKKRNLIIGTGVLIFLLLAYNIGQSLA